MKDTAKLIAVWGSPCSGKTTIATKLATAIYDTYQCRVIVLYTDLETPVIPVIFPNAKSEDLGTVGVPLSKVDIDIDDVINNLVTIQSRQNMGFIGYKAGENKFTYPRYGKAKAEDLIEKLKELADYVIVDCTSSIENNIMTQCALESADEIIRLASPDLKSISFYLSTIPMYKDSKYQFDRHNQGINIPNEDLYMPVEEAKSHLCEVQFTIPFSAQVKEKMLLGGLFEPTLDKKFEKRMKELAGKVVENEQQ